jgi:hypothetical protein
MRISRKELQKMLNEGIINGVDRDYGEDDGFGNEK